MGLSKQFTGTYLFGFVAFTALALLMLAMLRWVQIRWTRTWAEKGGRARATSVSPPAHFAHGGVKPTQRAAIDTRAV
jgi:MFS transporter, NNP family, nitrate/nitrite transporter